MQWRAFPTVGGKWSTSELLPALGAGALAFCLCPSIPQSARASPFCPRFGGPPFEVLAGRRANFGIRFRNLGRRFFSWFHDILPLRGAAQRRRILLTWGVARAADRLGNYSGSEAAEQPERDRQRREVEGRHALSTG